MSRCLDKAISRLSHLYREEDEKLRVMMTELIRYNSEIRDTDVGTLLFDYKEIKGKIERYEYRILKQESYVAGLHAAREEMFELKEEIREVRS